MIKNIVEKREKIIRTIRNNISEINIRYRSGPDLYFYKRIMELRSNSKDIKTFLKSDYHFEILYATLVAWDMNSRGAKLKYFDEFKENILSCMPHLINIEKFEREQNNSSLRGLLSGLYEDLIIMKTGGRLVSNSKLLHFLFPNLLMPMDRRNTLCFFYGHTGESLNKYLEIIDFSREIIRNNENLIMFIDDNWNKSIPKMIDNSILLLVGESVN